MPALGNWTQMTWSSGTTGALTLTKTATYPSFNELLVGLGFCAATNTNVSLEVHYDLVDTTNGTYERGIGSFNPSTNVLTRTLIQETGVTSGGVTTIDTTAPTAVTVGSSFSVYLGVTTSANPWLIPGTGFTGTTFTSPNIGFAPFNVNGAQGTAAMANTFEMWTPFLWLHHANLKNVNFRCSSAAANSRWGIYEMLDNGDPGALLWDSGDVANGNGLNTRTIASGTPTALTLPPGWYWMANNWNGTVTVTTGGGFNWNPVGMINSTNFNCCGGFYRTRTYASGLSNPGPAVTALTNNSNLTSYNATTGAPMFTFGVQA